MFGPLRGVRAIVLGELPAGTITGSLLSDLGAEVIHVSSPRVNHPLTHRPPVVNGESLAWQIIARSSKSATCDLDDEAGARLLRELLEHVDVVIESFGPGELEGHGLHPATFPTSVVLVRISSYGQDGPYSTYPGDDLTSLAFSGLAHLTGHRGGDPVPLATAIADYLCGPAPGVVMSSTRRSMAPLFASQSGPYLRLIGWAPTGLARVTFRATLLLLVCTPQRTTSSSPSWEELTPTFNAWSTRCKALKSAILDLRRPRRDLSKRTN
jgi:hypothetical protein